MLSGWRAQSQFLFFGAFDKSTKVLDAQDQKWLWIAPEAWTLGFFIIILAAFLCPFVDVLPKDIHNHFSEPENIPGGNRLFSCTVSCLSLFASIFLREVLKQRVCEVRPHIIPGEDSKYSIAVLHWPRDMGFGFWPSKQGLLYYFGSMERPLVCNLSCRNTWANTVGYWHRRGRTVVFVSV